MRDRHSSRRINAEALSQRALDALCSQLQCKGVLTLGEIVDGEEGDGSGEVFLSM
jgi:hypothetical protein